MSWWDNLFPAPNSTPPSDANPDDQTNSLLQSILSGAASLGSVLGKQAQGDASAQVQQGLLNNSNNSNMIGLYGQQQNAQNQAAQTDLERQQFGTNNRSQVAKQALIGKLLGGGLQPTSISVPGIKSAQFSGGLLNSLNSNPGALAAMQTLGNQASTAQNTPLKFTGGNLVTPPTLGAMPDVTKSTAKAKTGGILQDIGAIGKDILPFLGLFG